MEKLVNMQSVNQNTVNYTVFTVKKQFFLGLCSLSAWSIESETKITLKQVKPNYLLSFLLMMDYLWT